jgi:hypothetical protein
LRRALTAAVLLGCSLTGVLASPAMAAARDYAYMLVQGRLTGESAARPLAGVTVRLLAEGEVFETVTDSRGAFVFDKLPVASYDLQVVSSDGRTMQAFRDKDPLEGSRIHVRMRPGKKPPKLIRIEPNGEEISFVVPERPTNWNKLWAEVGIFVGLAALLAL